MYYQAKQDWSQGFDSLRLGMVHERWLGENIANSSLTCAVLLSKMNRFAEAIEYSQDAANEIERVMGVDSATQPLSEFKYTGKNVSLIREKDK